MCCSGSEPASLSTSWSHCEALLATNTLSLAIVILSEKSDEKRKEFVRGPDDSVLPHFYEQGSGYSVCSSAKRVKRRIFLAVPR